jgi:uroporphyrinogen-III synthase
VSARLPSLVVTRPEAQAFDWVHRLQALGASAIALPLLRIVAADDSADAIRQAWATLAERRLVMFVSPNAVAQFFALRPTGVSWPDGWSAPIPASLPLHPGVDRLSASATVLAGATGPGTVAALRQQGVPDHAIAAPSADAASFDAEALWRDALSDLDWRGARVLVVRGDGGRDWLADTLGAAGAQVQMLCAYRQLGPAWNNDESALLGQILARPTDHVWLFSSSQAIGHLAQRIQALRPDAAALLAAMSAITTHPRIAASARSLGLGRVASCAPRPGEVYAALQEGWPASIE